MSTTGLTPTYNVITIDMGDTDGQNPQGRRFSQQIGFLQVAFRDGSGNPISNRQLQLAFGQNSTDRLTLDYNGKARIQQPIFKDGKIVDYQACDNWRVFWDNVPNVFAVLTVSQDARLFENDTPNPLQSFTSSIGATVSTAAVTVTASATLISAASSSRQSVTILNNAATSDIFIGGLGVTTSNGLRIPANGYLTLDKNIAAIYGISTASVGVRVLTESL